MILSDQTDNSKVKAAIALVPINTYFAQAVISKKVNGKIYVDDVHNPTTFYVLHPYGMSLLFGKSDNEEFNCAFAKYAFNENKKRNHQEWMQAYPESWNNRLQELCGDRLVPSAINKGNHENIELNTRVNFKFNPEKFNAFKQKEPALEFTIVKTDEKIFNEMKGSVVPAYFWNSAADFLENGIGFSLFYNGKLASTAYASFIIDDKLELGIETVEEFRGLGLAQYSCAALIDYCIQNNYEPVWACRKENTGSYRLAQKLGFEPSKEIPYYKLCEHNNSF